MVWVSRLGCSFDSAAFRRRPRLLCVDSESCLVQGIFGAQFNAQETQAEGETESHFTLFDTGPESRSISRNIASLRIPVERISRVVLSHWHSDHSGGILAFLRLRQQAVAAASAHEQQGACVVDLHPDRPVARGIAPGGKIMCRLAADPTFEDIEQLGGVVEKHSEGHSVAGGTVYVSGEIPRVTEFENGLLGAVRWVTNESTGEDEWVPEEVSHVLVFISLL